MPNYVQNEVRINGTKDELEEVRRFLNGESAFDFHNLIPEPKELLTYRSPLASPDAIRYVAEHSSNENAPYSADVLANARRALSNIERFGAPDWYEWRCINWGTKWNAGDVSVKYEENAGELLFEFLTAWTWPEPIFLALINRFPTLGIQWDFHEETEGYFRDEEDDSKLVETWHSAVGETLDPDQLEDCCERLFSVVDYERSVW